MNNFCRICLQKFGFYRIKKYTLYLLHLSTSMSLNHLYETQVRDLSEKFKDGDGKYVILSKPNAEKKGTVEIEDEDIWFFSEKDLKKTKWFKSSLKALEKHKEFKSIKEIYVQFLFGNVDMSELLWLNYEEMLENFAENNENIKVTICSAFEDPETIVGESDELDSDEEESGELDSGEDDSDECNTDDTESGSELSFVESDEDDESETFSECSDSDTEMDPEFLLLQLQRALSRLELLGVKTNLCKSCGIWEEVGKKSKIIDDKCKDCIAEEDSEDESEEESESSEEVMKSEKISKPKPKEESKAEKPVDEPKFSSTPKVMKKADKSADKKPVNTTSTSSTSDAFDIHYHVTKTLIPHLKKEKSGWEDFFSDPNTIKLVQKLTSDLAEFDNIQPSLPNVFNAFTIGACINPKNIKVVLIGMDPYPKKGAAMGLAFSHPPTAPTQQSLLNIYKELKSEGFTYNEKSGDLTKWVNEGVFLFNAALTVTEGKSGSHSKVWKDFSEAALTYLNKISDNLVVIMWGNDAQKLGKKCFNNQKHKFLVSTHPSPQAINNKNSNFFGSKPFSKANAYLKEWGVKSVNWNLS